MRHTLLGLAFLLLAATTGRADMRLLMLDQPHCEWCEIWETEIGGAYHLTDEGAVAPLLRANIHEPLPDGVTLDRNARFTPTFVLLRDGQEVGRLEGYAGEEFFYPMLGRLLDAALAKTGPDTHKE
ncbi:MAG: thioredoxin family protein [Pseudomonadota bacterium]